MLNLSVIIGAVFVMPAIEPVEALAQTENNAATCKRQSGALRAVSRVIDGETLVLDDGSQVRLVGALSPRGWDASTISWPLERAARAALERLTLGRSIRLYYLGSARRDRHRRRLAHAFVEKDNGKTNRNGLWLQAEMIRLGFARAYGLPDNFSCLGQLLELEEAARTSKVGLWTNAAYAVRSSKHTGELNRYLGTYQLVAGTVSGVTKHRGTIYINFGDATSESTIQSAGKNAQPSWRTDFTAYIPRDSVAAQTTQAINASLVGQRVIVRGWLERRNGPAIRIHDARQIKRLPPVNNDR